MKVHHHPGIVQALVNMCHHGGRRHLGMIVLTLTPAMISPQLVKACGRGAGLLIHKAHLLQIWIRSDGFHEETPAKCFS